MAIFLRGDVWWMEYRTRSVRVVRSTGFRKPEKSKAQAAFDALRLAMRTNAPRDTVASLLEAIYGAKKGSDDQILPISSLEAIYRDWLEGKGRVLKPKTLAARSSNMQRFAEWCASRGVVDARKVTVPIARQYIRTLAAEGRANKTLRNTGADLAHVWNTVTQMLPDPLPNPWRAAIPDDDRTSIRRGAFTVDQEASVLAAAKQVGHGWYLASMIARWTGLRYGDVANLEWHNIDLVAGVIRVTPSKTARHGVKVVIPIAQPLRDVLEAIPTKEGLLLPEQALNLHHMPVPFGEVLRVAGLDTERYTYHSWRHTFRTRLAEAQVNAEAAKRLGGWTSDAMASHYDHASHLAELQAAISAVEMLDQK